MNEFSCMIDQNNIECRISVIMGIYNCADTLPESLDSILYQTYQSFKVIMCDDGSTDNTFLVAKQYADKYKNFILIKNNENKGLNETLNHCLLYADTEFIARMDGDDISLPTRFEKEINFLDEHKEIAIVSTAMIYFDEHGDYRQGNPIQYPQLKDFIRGTPFCHAPSMVRKAAYDSVFGYSVDKKLIRVEDYHLWFKMYSRGYMGFNFKEPLYKMRDYRNAYARRKFKYRINEMYVRHIGYKMLKLPFYYQIYALRPIFVGLLPEWLYQILHKWNGKSSNHDSLSIK